jgi:hypothetical protein
LLPFLGCCSVRMRAIIPTFRRQILPPSWRSKCLLISRSCIYV